MATTRKLALWIARTIVRRSAPAAQEWAEASLQEIEQIPDDWAALRWSLGSLHILFERGERPLRTRAEISQAAERLAGKIRKRTVSGILIAVTESVFFVHRITLLHTSIEQLANCLAIAAMVYLGVQVFLYRTRIREGEPNISLDAYRKELVRQRDFHCNGWFWSRLAVLIVAALVFCLGGALAHPAKANAFTVYAIIMLGAMVIAVFLNARISRKYQRRLDELEVIESEI